MTVEKYATIITCLVEFNSMAQALSFQNEIDRNKSNIQQMSNAAPVTSPLKGSKKSIGISSGAGKTGPNSV